MKGLTQDHVQVSLIWESNEGTCSILIPFNQEVLDFESLVWLDASESGTFIVVISLRSNASLDVYRLDVRHLIHHVL